MANHYHYAFVFPGDAGLKFRHLFTRLALKRLSGRPYQQITDTTVEQCASICVKDTEHHCKSFDMDNTLKMCDLFTVSVDDPDVRLLDTEHQDHYQRKCKIDLLRRMCDDNFFLTDYSSTIFCS